jgi:glycosyltransferase involved in cell wall biosynthesis
MRVAVVHDWLVTFGGAERVLREIVNMFPSADIFTLVDFLPREDRSFLQGRLVRTSFLQKIPRAKHVYRQLLPLMPLAIEQFDLSDYDLVISSSHAVAKGVITGPDQLHISYTHTPIRYAWDLQHQYLRESNMSRGVKSWIARLLLGYIRMWDYRTSNGVDEFVANSQFIARRIWKIYRRKASVIYPPVDVSRFSMVSQKDEFYLTASRLVPYKRVDLIVESFRAMPNLRLFVIGDGPELEKIKAIAPSNVTLLGHQPIEVLIDYMQKAKAFIYAAEEDFGIAPVEAQACGTPVIAYGRGGLLETVRGVGGSSHPTGLFFHTQSTDSIIDALQRFEQLKGVFSPEVCRKNALRFSTDRFRSEFMSFVNERIASSKMVVNNEGELYIE